MIYTVPVLAMMHVSASSPEEAQKTAIWALGQELKVDETSLVAQDPLEVDKDSVPYYYNGEMLRLVYMQTEVPAVVCPHLENKND
jgi:hypothetical protein